MGTGAGIFFSFFEMEDFHVTQGLEIKSLSLQKYYKHHFKYFEVTLKLTCTQVHTYCLAEYAIWFSLPTTTDASAGQLHGCRESGSEAAS